MLKATSYQRSSKAQERKHLKKLKKLRSNSWNFWIKKMIYLDSNFQQSQRSTVLKLKSRANGECDSVIPIEIWSTWISNYQQTRPLKEFQTHVTSIKKKQLKLLPQWN